MRLVSSCFQAKIAFAGDCINSITITNNIFVFLCAGVVKLVDTLVLGTSAVRRVGSSPITRTNRYKNQFVYIFFLFQ